MTAEEKVAALKNVFAEHDKWTTLQNKYFDELRAKTNGKPNEAMEAYMAIRIGKDTLELVERIRKIIS